jgi:hypothetical protein
MDVDVVALAGSLRFRLVAQAVTARRTADVAEEYAYG